MDFEKNEGGEGGEEVGSPASPPDPTPTPDGIGSHPPGPTPTPGCQGVGSRGCQGVGSGVECQWSKLGRTGQQLQPQSGTHVVGVPPPHTQQVVGSV